MSTKDNTIQERRLERYQM